MYLVYPVEGVLVPIGLGKLFQCHYWQPDNVNHYYPPLPLHLCISESHASQHFCFKSSSVSFSSPCHPSSLPPSLTSYSLLPFLPPSLPTPSFSLPPSLTHSFPHSFPPFLTPSLSHSLPPFLPPSTPHPPSLPSHPHSWHKATNRRRKSDDHRDSKGKEGTRTQLLLV